MHDQFLAHILIFSILAASCIRIFFIDSERIDSLAVGPTVAFFLSLMTAFIYNINFVTVFAILLSLLCCATNLRPLLRLKSRLIVDHYNPAFILFSVLELLLAVAALALIVFYRPVRFDEKNLEELGVTKTKTSIGQNDFYVFKSNFTEEAEPVVEVDEESPAPSENIILFVPGDFGQVSDYESYLAMLAKNGFTVVTADFFSKETGFFDNIILDSRFLKKSATLAMYFFDKKYYDELKKKNEKKVALRFDFIYEFARKNLTNLNNFDPTAKIFIVLEKLTIDEKNAVFEKFDGKVLAYSAMENITEYKTNNFGFPEQTNPILAAALGLSRDKTFFIPRYMANRTKEEIFSSFIAF